MHYAGKLFLQNQEINKFAVSGPCEVNEIKKEIFTTVIKFLETNHLFRMGGKENIDTSKLRSSVWYYVHRLWGIYYYNVDYSMIQELLPPGFRNYIFCTTCMPEQLKEDIFNNWESKRGFTHSEKVLL